jgi:acyl-coenzyme A synthetase/AMP-(fatty) acid ligase
MAWFFEVERHADRMALISSDAEPMTYAALARTADRIAEQVVPRSVVVQLCDNDAASVAGYLGFLRRGAVPLLVNANDRGPLGTLLDAYRPRYLYLPDAIPDPVSGCTLRFGYDGYRLVETAFAIDYAVHDELALLLTTSGSTGSPKLVRLSRRNLQTNAESIAQYLEISERDRPITTLPMSYSYGLSIVHSHLLRGAAIITTRSTLMERAFWDCLKTHAATTFGGVPYTYEMLKKLRFARMTLPALRYLTQAGGKLGQELAAELAEQCHAKGVRLVIMYGQTEATARMAYLPWDQARAKPGSIGVAIPNGRLWLEDDAGQPIEHADAPGELVYAGDNVSLGYASDRQDLAKGDEHRGVLRTGDIAQRDRDGHYYIVGRKKRFLKVFGNRVNLDEVEQLVRAAGHDCACAGIDDHLVVYVTQDGEVAAVRSLLTDRTGVNMQGVAVVRIERIPRNESGKVLYSALP